MLQAIDVFHIKNIHFIFDFHVSAKRTYLDKDKRNLKKKKEAGTLPFFEKATNLMTSESDPQPYLSMPSTVRAGVWS